MLGPETALVRWKIHILHHAESRDVWGTSAPHARARQAFRITPAGKCLLEELRREVVELYEEVVLDHDKAPDKGARS